MRRLNALDLFALIFTIIGGLNMGLLGVMNIDVISYLLGDLTVFSRVIHIIIGVCAIYIVFIAMLLRKK